MSVSPANLGQVAGVVRDCRVMGYGMFSFQPAAFVGDQRRWHEDYRDVTGDQVWTQIERGAGTTLDYRVFEHGDVRCNRAAYGFWAGDRWYPFLDGSDPGDLAVRDAFFRYFGPVNFTGTPAGLLAVRIALIAARHPRVIPLAGGWARRRRAGALGAGNAGFAAESDAGPGPGHGRPAAGRRRGSTGGAGWAAGAGACAATALRAWPAALGLWLANRLLDGLDGPVARAGTPTDPGGLSDSRAHLPRLPRVTPRPPPALPARS